MKRKLFLSLFTLFLVMWGVASWVLGNNAEQQLRLGLIENNNVLGQTLFRAELLTYKKTVFGAEARLKISSDIPFISERVGEFPVKMTLLNGPVFITQSGVSVGSSRWRIEIDKANFSEAELENIKQLFPYKLPRAIVRLDFENKANYVISAQTAMADALITGFYNLDTFDNRGAIKLSEFNATVENVQFRAEKLHLSYQHQKALTASYKPGTTALDIPKLTITNQETQRSVNLHVKANSNISLSERYLNGFIALNLDQLERSDIPLDSITMRVLFKGISADGFIIASEAQADLENLRLQIDWAVEDGSEYPEGQDQIVDLYKRSEESAALLPELLAKGLFNQESLVQFKATSVNQSGDSELIGQLALVKTEFSSKHEKTSKKRGGVLSNNIKNQSISETTLLKTLMTLVHGEASVRLDSELHKALSKYMEIKSNPFLLRLKDNKITQKSKAN